MNTELIKLLAEGISPEGIIKGVHLVGLQSSNRIGNNKQPYTYKESALKEALTLYNDVSVYLNHGYERRVEDKIGIVKNASYRDGKGVFGDIVMNTAHPMYESIKWWIQNQPSKIGMSHVAGGSYNEDENAIDKIKHVESVDIVAQPSTTKGMFKEDQQGSIDYFGAMVEEIADKMRLAVHPLKESLTPDKASLELAKLLTEAAQTIKPTIQKEKDMDWKDITLESLREHRADLVTGIETAAVAKERDIDAKVTEAIKELDDKAKTKPFVALVREHIAAGKDVKDLVEDRKTLITTVVESQRPAGTQHNQQGQPKAITDDDILAAFK